MKELSFKFYGAIECLKIMDKIAVFLDLLFVFAVCSALREHEEFIVSSRQMAEEINTLNVGYGVLF